MMKKLRGLIKKRSWLGTSLGLLTIATITWTYNAIAVGISNQLELDHVQEVKVSGGELIERGKALYESGNFLEAAKVLQQAVTVFEQQGDRLNQAIALSNFSLVNQQLGEWEQAKTAIATSLNLLRNDKSMGSDRWRYLAQALDIQGRLELATGQTELALTSWQEATEIYKKNGETLNVARGILNQAQALQTLGLYRRALTTLKEVEQTLHHQPSSLLKAVTLRSLGDGLRVVGNLDESEIFLQQSLQIAKELKSAQAIADALLSLGNTLRSQQKPDQALKLYQEAANIFISPLGQLQALLNEFSLLSDNKQFLEAEKLIPIIQAQLEKVPESRSSIYARINFAQNWLKAENSTNSINHYQEIGQQLATSVQAAQRLGDQRSEAYALGNFGYLYEKTQQWEEAKKLTQQALNLAQIIEAPDIAYQYQWQMGRLLKATGDRKGAITLYTEAVNNLKSLRSDLVSINPDIQFSFRESVEPVYRELVALLLQDVPISNVKEISGKDQLGSGQNQENLIQARSVIESLQLAELDNFFREACLDAKPKQIDQVDPSAAVIYPIILPDRIEIILSLPGKNLRHYSINVSQKEVESRVDELRKTLPAPYLGKLLILSRSQKVYNWLIRPLEAELTSQNIKTLVFVPDGVFRNIPMGALYDGKKFLLEKYAIAVTPGLQLLPSQGLARGHLQAITGGLSEARLGFSALPYVKIELDQIKSEIPTKLLLNQNFTKTTIQNAINSASYPVIHLATHGQFSSKAEDTFILTWDSRINVNQLNELLRSREQNEGKPIELLVLSACKTAVGDNRAALGLAGVAIRAGARSTIATLWSVSDEATATLMTQFYHELEDAKVTKAEALRRAQEKLLHNPRFQQPTFWAPYVLVGNWQ